MKTAQGYYDNDRSVSKALHNSTIRSSTIPQTSRFDRRTPRESSQLPLRVNGSVIGAVGIFGTQQELQYLAPLLELYAAKYYQLEAMTTGEQPVD